MALPNSRERKNNASAGEKRRTTEKVYRCLKRWRVTLLPTHLLLLQLLASKNHGRAHRDPADSLPVGVSCFRRYDSPSLSRMSVECQKRRKIRDRVEWDIVFLINYMYTPCCRSFLQVTSRCGCLDGMKMPALWVMGNYESRRRSSQGLREGFSLAECDLATAFRIDEAGLGMCRIVATMLCS